MYKRVKNVIVNPVTGAIEFRFPLELTHENKESLDELIKIKGYEVGIARLGYRSFLAAMIPSSEAQYHELIKDELNRQEEIKQSGRCPISDGKGKLKRCPMRVPNPAYVEGCNEPKTLPVKCDGCKFNTFDKKEYGTITFSCLTTIDENEEDTGFEPVAPSTYYAGTEYEALCEKWVNFIKDKKPELADLADLLAQEYLRSEAANALKKPASTVRSQGNTLKQLVEEFLDNLISLS